MFFKTEVGGGEGGRESMNLQDIFGSENLKLYWLLNSKPMELAKKSHRIIEVYS